MAIVYDRLFQRMKALGATEYYLRNNGISPSIFTKLRHGTGGLDARTIDKLCRLLDCQPGELMEYISDPPEDFNAIDDMSAKEFEDFVLSLLRQLGYEATMVIKVMGMDIQATKDGRLYAVECKHTSGDSIRAIGTRIVFDTWDVIQDKEIDSAIIVTNGRFTEAANEAADKLGIALWDREVLLESMSSIQDK